MNSCFQCYHLNNDLSFLQGDRGPAGTPGVAGIPVCIFIKEISFCYKNLKKSQARCLAVILLIVSGSS